MLGLYRRLLDKRGNASLMWVSFVPVFMLLLLFVGSVMKIGITHAATSAAAEAGSLATAKSSCHRKKGRPISKW